ncbi:unnamed protein product, partial [Mesorhabditis spiculigera]
MAAPGGGQYPNQGGVQPHGQQQMMYGNQGQNPQAQGSMGRGGYQQGMMMGQHQMGMQQQGYPNQQMPGQMMHTSPAYPNNPNMMGGNPQMMSQQQQQMMMNQQQMHAMQQQQQSGVPMTQQQMQLQQQQAAQGSGGPQFTQQPIQKQAKGKIQGMAQPMPMSNVPQTMSSNNPAMQQQMHQHQLQQQRQQQMQQQAHMSQQQMPQHGGVQQQMPGHQQQQQLHPLQGDQMHPPQMGQGPAQQQQQQLHPPSQHHLAPGQQQMTSHAGPQPQMPAHPGAQQQMPGHAGPQHPMSQGTPQMGSQPMPGSQMSSLGPPMQQQHSNQGMLQPMSNQSVHQPLSQQPMSQQGQPGRSPMVSAVQQQQQQVHTPQSHQQMHTPGGPPSTGPGMQAPRSQGPPGSQGPPMSQGPPLSQGQQPIPAPATPGGGLQNTEGLTCKYGHNPKGITHGMTDCPDCSTLSMLYHVQKDLRSRAFEKSTEAEQPIVMDPTLATRRLVDFDLRAAIQRKAGRLRERTHRKTADYSRAYDDIMAIVDTIEANLTTVVEAQKQSLIMEKMYDKEKVIPGAPDATVQFQGIDTYIRNTQQSMEMFHRTIANVTAMTTAMRKKTAGYQEEDEDMDSTE